MPFAVRKNGRIHTLGYLLDQKEFHDKKTIDKVVVHPDSKRLGYRMTQEESWIIPDFRPWFCDFEVQTRSIGSSNTQVFSVHIPTHIQRRH
jgi:hypothetical protein